MPELINIELIYIREIIPEKLYSKFERNNILKVEDVINLDPDDFRKFRSVGVAVEKLFSELKNRIIEDPDLILQLYRQNSPKNLPFESEEMLDIIRMFENIVENYLFIVETSKYKTPKEYKRNSRDIDIIRKCFGLKSVIYQKEKIGKRHRLDPERIRQISEEFISDIKNLVNGKSLDDKKCSCKSEAVSLMKSFTNELSGEILFNERTLIRIFKDKGIDVSYYSKKNYVLLLLKVLGYEQVPVARYQYLKKNLIFSNGSVENELVLNTADTIVRFLKKRVIPSSLDDIIIEVRNKYDLSDDFIRSVCEMINEIEKTESNNYQMSFEFLSSIRDFACRVLYEEKKSLTYEELLYLINRKLVSADKCIDLAALKRNLRKDKNIEPVGRTGSWSLRHSQNTESQIKLIMRTMRILDKPLTTREITDYINNNLHRKDVRYRSVSSHLTRNYRSHFIKLKNNSYALAEAGHKYEQVIGTTKLREKKHGILKVTTITNIAITILKKYEGSMLLKDLARIVNKTDKSISQMSVYRVINDNPLIFRKTLNLGRQKVVSLITL
jgi:hypothetical protein